jgi:serine/threonine protein kinase
MTLFSAACLLPAALLPTDLPADALIIVEMGSQQPDLHLGRIFADKYRIEERLGSGGMCHVYRARHIVIDKEVALKVLRAELAADPQVAVQFEQEARATSRIHHPHALDVTDFGVTEDSWYFISRRLEHSTRRNFSHAAQLDRYFKSARR